MPNEAVCRKAAGKLRCTAEERSFVPLFQTEDDFLCHFRPLSAQNYVKGMMKNGTESFNAYSLFGCMVAVGLYCRRHATDVNGFVLGGRSVGPWLTAFAYGTSYFSAVIFIGYAGQFGWKYGIAATWIGLGNALIGSLLAWVLLGRRTRLMTQKLSTATMPEFFGKRYRSNAFARRRLGYRFYLFDSLHCVAL